MSQPIPAAAPARPYRRARRAEERVTILGREMDLIRPEELFLQVGRSIAAKTRLIVGNHNLHSLYLCRKDPVMRAFFEQADVIEADSTPVIAWARMLGQPSRTFHRCTYLDWRDLFWETAAARGWKVYVLGGAPGVGETARRVILDRWPSAILRTRAGFFDMTPDGPDNAAVLRDIAGFSPDVILAGMGMPRQEAWLMQNLDALPACAMFTVGAAFDYEAGLQTPCPRWIGRLGLEWLFRLALNPGRLFSRYCIEPWFLLGPAFTDIAAAMARRTTRA